MRMELEKIAAAIRNARIGAGFTQKEVAEVFGKGQTTVASWETGRSQPDASTIIALSNLFHVSSDYLVGIGLSFAPDTTPERVPIASEKSYAEDVQALIPSARAVLEAAEDQVSRYIRSAPVNGGLRDYLTAHAENVQNLLAVVVHLLGEMEDTQSLVISLCSGCRSEGPEPVR